MMIEFLALGPVAVTRDGTPTTGRALHRKNLALLTYLGRSPNRRRTREQIVGVLWADKNDQTARHSLRQAIRDLKADLGDDVLMTSPADVALPQTAIRFDFDQFDELRGREQWTEAAALARGEFMEGFSVAGASAFEDWLSHERAAWRRRSVEVLLAAATQALAAGDVATGADFAGRATTIDPHSDAAVQIAMRCAAIEGNPGGAVSLFHHFRDGLAELGLEPNETTRRLADAVEGERQWQIPDPRGSKDEPTRRAPLVGRAAELRSALQEWNRARTRGNVRLVLIEGDQGAGKTRLGEEITARARLDGAHTAWVRSVEADAETSWSGIAGLFAGGLLESPGLAGADPADLAAIGTVVPEVKRRFAATADRVGQIDLAVPRVLKAVSEEQPLVLAFDDAHYLDDESIGLIHVMARDLDASPVLLLLTLSPQHPRPEIEDVRARLGRELRGRSIEVGALNHEHLATLGRFFLRRYTSEQLDRLTRRIMLDSGGIPLLAVELLHAVAIGLNLGDESSDWPQPGRTLDQTAPGELPSAVIGAIRAAYWRAPEDARTVLLAVAALGDRVTRHAIQAATELPKTALNGLLDWLEWERWLVSERRGYDYAARIVREIIVRDMLTPGQAERYRSLVTPKGS